MAEDAGLDLEWFGPPMFQTVKGKSIFELADLEAPLDGTTNIINLTRGGGESPVGGESLPTAAEVPGQRPGSSQDPAPAPAKAPAPAAYVPGQRPYSAARGASPPTTVRRARVLTNGFRKFGLTPHGQQSPLFRMWIPERGGPLPSERVFASACVQANVHTDLVFSALDLHDPASSSYHTGLADEVFQPLWQPQYMSVWDSILCRTAHFLKHTDKELITIMVYCKSGKHRASAWPK